MDEKLPVVQQDGLGCGLACLSFMLEVPYLKLKESISIEKGLTCNEICKILISFGIPGEYKYIKPKLRYKIYKDNTIVFIKRSRKYPFGHYLVRSGNRWMDSWINFPSTLEKAKAGFRKKLPGKPIYMISVLETKKSPFLETS